MNENTINAAVEDYIKAIEDPSRASQEDLESFLEANKHVFDLETIDDAEDWVVGLSPELFRARINTLHAAIHMKRWKVDLRKYVRANEAGYGGGNTYRTAYVRATNWQDAVDYAIAECGRDWYLWLVNEEAQ